MFGPAGLHPCNGSSVESGLVLSRRGRCAWLGAPKDSCCVWGFSPCPFTSLSPRG